MSVPRCKLCGHLWLKTQWGNGCATRGCPNRIPKGREPKKK